jgi:hypothetical protein
MTAEQYANENVKLVEVSFSEVPEYVAWKECEEDFINYHERYSLEITEIYYEWYISNLGGRPLVFQPPNWTVTKKKLKPVVLPPKVLLNIN